MKVIVTFVDLIKKTTRFNQQPTGFYGVNVVSSLVDHTNGL